MNNLLLPVGIAILAALNILDLITTRQMIDSGKGVERNPVMAWLFKMLPEQLWWLTKMPFTPAVSGCGLSTGHTALLGSGCVVCSMQL